MIDDNIKYLLRDLFARASSEQCQDLIKFCLDPTEENLKKLRILAGEIYEENDGI